jgi:hypothetical protein
MGGGRHHGHPGEAGSVLSYKVKGKWRGAPAYLGSGRGPSVEEMLARRKNKATLKYDARRKELRRLTLEQARDAKTSK